jgi:hypothetical protein
MVVNRKDALGAFTDFPVELNLLREKGGLASPPLILSETYEL